VSPVGGVVVVVAPPSPPFALAVFLFPPCVNCQTTIASANTAKPTATPTFTPVDFFQSNPAFATGPGPSITTGRSYRLGISAMFMLPATSPSANLDETARRR
jgi:hypothetical protein